MKGLGRSGTLQASPALTSTTCMAGTTGVAWKMTPQTQWPIQPYPYILINAGSRSFYPWTD